MKFIELLATQCRNIFVPIVSQPYHKSGGGARVSEISALPM